MPSLKRNRTPSDLVVHADCPVHRHGEDDSCICPTRWASEKDARSGGAIPAKDAAIEMEFKAMPRPKHQASSDERAFLGRDDLACHGEDLGLFYPMTGRWKGADAQVRAAKAVCRRCPATAECLAYAYATGDDFAVLGGTTPNERREMRRGDVGVRPVEDAA